MVTWEPANLYGFKRKDNRGNLVFTELYVVFPILQQSINLTFGKEGLKKTF